ncbi:MAG: LPS-assembly protein LptD [Acidobacteria bacterium]|nr:MAG: LPS-assembly protein LptD [Acidobacteriota bacterium]REK05630.1 MAG: LPS-assembly protein LptD [Acidobacteriota bacterium]
MLKPPRVLAAALSLAVGALLFAQSSLAQPPTAPPQEPSTAAAAEGSDPEGGAEEGSESAEPDRRNQFELQLDPEQGGGTVVGKASSIEFDGASRAILTGDVELVYQDLSVRADFVELDRDTDSLRASGNVVFDQGPRRLIGDELEFDLENKTGRFQQVEGYVSQDYYFTGESVAKTGDDTFVIERGEFSSCQGENPAWSFSARKIDLTVDRYAKARGAAFRIKGAPVLYFPYVLWPAKDDRASGFLVPKPGYSSRRGASLGLAYYQTLGRSYDTTFHVDLFGGGAPQGSLGTGSFLGLGNEFRYRPSATTEGLFQGYAIRDPERDEWRWKLSLDHTSEQLPLGFRGVVHLEDVSDFDYFQDYERRGDRNSQRRLYSNAFVTRNWGSHSLNVRMDSRETLLGQNRVVTLRQLPEIEYRLRSTRLGRSPLYLAVESSVHYLDMERSAALDEGYARGDLYPELTLPIRTVPWLSLSLSAGGRLTWYSDSLLLASEAEESGATSFFRGESIDRFSPTLSAEIVGPSLSRIFEGGGEKWSRFKHVIEPRFTYGFFDEFEDQDRLPVFDEIDNLRGANRGRFSIINRLLAKPADESEGSAREILALEVFQDYSFDDTQPLQISGDRSEELQEGPIGVVLRYNPSRSTNLRTNVSYDTLAGGVDSTSLSGTFALNPRNQIGVRWTARRNVEADRTQTHQLRLSTGLGLTDRLRLDASLNYDFNEDFIQYQRHMLSYRGSCYGLSIEYGDFRVGDERDTEYRFLVTLKNVGTFLDLNGGTTETF